ncbi:MAG TPA: DUF1648 domain-containing protein [Opitutaceae bacterium]|nr:DUF1648 domain-containing protein [Opitutaceae bacterium]
MKYPQFLLLVALAVLSVVQAAWLQFHLPALVATHFNAAGEVNGWMSRAYFLRYELGFTLGMGALFTTLAFLCVVLPAALINLPRKDYWLAPERSTDTRRRLAGMALACGCGAEAFFIFLHQQLYLANLRSDHQLPIPAGVTMAVAVVLIAGPVLRPLLRFSRKPAPPA